MQTRVRLVIELRRLRVTHRETTQRRLEPTECGGVLVFEARHEKIIPVSIFVDVADLRDLAVTRRLPGGAECQIKVVGQ
ncbi:hypothetical protein D3C76_1415530 [compost metagenome]